MQCKMTIKSILAIVVIMMVLISIIFCNMYSLENPNNNNNNNNISQRKRNPDHSMNSFLDKLDSIVLEKNIKNNHKNKETTINHTQSTKHVNIVVPLSLPTERNQFLDPRYKSKIVIPSHMISI